ncbi:ribonuclease domain-containing protein [Kitasatospora sp. NPDC059146]|uniref:ribonuclease domain-containing protein n=1 Tax=Kitasatospora sp. NPDC059146 TaxID=3346741 RepID=UPI0036D1A425
MTARLAKTALALLLTVGLAPAAVPAHAVTAARAPAALLQPPLPLEAFPPQVARACDIWRQLEWPATPQPITYRLPDGEFIRGGNPYGNRSGDLPHATTYHEYDVNPRPTANTHRDAERIVRDTVSKRVYYSDDHYADFREISYGC